MTDFSIEIPSFIDLKPLHQNWTWQEIQWGKKKGIINAQDTITYAIELLEENREDFSTLLALSIESADGESIDQAIADLCCYEKKESESEIELVWRKAILRWLYQNVKCTNALQQSVDMLYADFDYPEDMSSLIGYMPAKLRDSEMRWSIEDSLRKYVEQ